MKEKLPNSIRIMSHNVSSLPFNHPDKFHQILQYMSDHKVDIGILQEVNINMQQHDVHQMLKTVINYNWTHHQMIAISTPDILPRFYQPGGIIIVCQESIAHRITQKGKDAPGRWARVLLEGGIGAQWRSRRMRMVN